MNDIFILLNTSELNLVCNGLVTYRSELEVDSKEYARISKLLTYLEHQLSIETNK